MAVRSSTRGPAVIHFAPRIPNRPKTSRSFSGRSSNIITRAFIEKYDQFIQLPNDKKLDQLIDRALNLLHDSSRAASKSREVMWNLLKDKVVLAPYKPEDSAKNLLELLPHLKIPTLGDPTKELSPASSDWRNRRQFTIPLSGQMQADHLEVNKMLSSHLKGKVALIGAATWNSDETFRTLRYLAEVKKPLFSISYVSNVEINPINAKLAFLTSQELGLDRRKFTSFEGNAVEGLPSISRAFSANSHCIIACRLFPHLSFYEISKLLTHIQHHLNITRGHSIITYPIVSIAEMSKPTSDFFIKYLDYYHTGVFKIEKLNDSEGNLIGISFISQLEQPEAGLIKNSLFQTIFFQESIPILLTDLHRLKIIERRQITGEDLIQREVALVSHI